MMRSIRHSNQKGLTLIEMMIAMVVALILVGGVITMFVTSVRSNVDHIKMMRLNQDIRAITTLMTRELQIANADETAIFGASAGADYQCDICDVNTQDGIQLDYAVYVDGEIKNKSFTHSGSTVVFDPGSGNAEGISSPDISYTNLQFEVEYLVSDVWVEEPNPSDPVDATRVNILLDAQIRLSGDGVAQRSINKTIRVRN